jgi:predicted nucleic acid-binding protein
MLMSDLGDKPSLRLTRVSIWAGSHCHPEPSSMNDRVFVDTNVLVYAHDLDAGTKHAVAERLLRDLWESEAGIISTQVLQEFYVNVTRKISTPISPPEARGILSAYAAWQVELTRPADVLQVSEVQERYRLSFWDAMIIVTAAKGQAAVLVTEDLNPGQIIEGVQIINPLQ